MQRRLFWKFFLAYILIGIASFILIATLGSRMVEKALIESSSRRLYLEADRISSSRNAIFISDADSLADMDKTLTALAQYQNSRIWLLSPQGEILLDTAGEVSAGSPEILENFDPVALGSGYYTIGRFFGYFDQDVMSIMVPITSNLNIRGYVAIHMDMDEIYSSRELLLSRFYLLFLILFLVFFLFLVLVLFFIYRPLKRIIRGAQEYASGNLDYQIPCRSNDEMGYLAQTLNFMSDELKRTDEYQRKFVANVSHDFRSPLTSIKGYVEAILDGTIPPEMQEKYLNIVLFETDRLNKLTRSMLALNRMDNKGFYLDIKDFDINTVIKTTAASFEGTCTAKRISIELLLSAEKLYVSADMIKIQQVLYNLIDNAIKFSPNNSTIRIETTERHGKVFVSVKDNGIGIPRNSLSKIWERFYKIDASRGKDRKGTGLGLSIVREIISAHKQNINVISTEGIGTEFVFSLDLAKQENTSPQSH